MSKKNVLILLGGYWHDFEGFAAAMGLFLEEQGYAVRATYDFDALVRLRDSDLILSYTCLSGPPEGETNPGPTGFSRAQLMALSQWVQEGGALLAAHAATVPGNTGPELERLLGGAFLSHPPEMTFTALPLSGWHPITDGIEAFEVHDELYIQRYHPSVQVHMVAEYQGAAHPIAWSRSEGRGRVAHVALGHSKDVWKLEAYQRLMLQTIEWLAKAARGP
jgi:type 1 glutamine amidotransferase